MLQCVAVCWISARAAIRGISSCTIGVFQCVAVCCSVLHCVEFHFVERYEASRAAPYVCCSVLQCVAVCCSVVQYCIVLDFSTWSDTRHLELHHRCVAVCCSVWQYVAASTLSETRGIERHEAF